MTDRIFEFVEKRLPKNNRIERIWKIAQVDFKRRYYNDVLGLLWALANPLSQIGLYYFIFTRIFKKEQENYVLYIFCGIILWLAFAEASRKGSLILKEKQYLMENIQFNWVDLYISHMLSITYGMVFNFFAYAIISLLYRNTYGEYFYLFPIVLLTWFIFGLAISIILSLLRPLFEDSFHIWNILLNIGFWSSGIFYSGTYFFEDYTWFSYINPFIGIILNARACLLENNELYPFWLIYNFLFAGIFLVVAIYIFKKNIKKVTEKI